jgi:hypothetical protein
MKLDNISIKEIAKRVTKLNSLEKELSNFRGFSISITKLTILKFLCNDSFSMCQFAYYLSLKIEDKIQIYDREENLKNIITDSLRIMKNIIKDAKLDSRFGINNNHINALKEISITLRDSQNEIKKLKWSNIRLIHNWNVFLLEQAIDCYIYSDQPEMGYKLAKSYTERYEPSFGTGLIPDSLESLKEINQFWNAYLENIIKKFENDGKIKLSLI